MLLAGDNLEVKASLCPLLDCLLCQDSLPASQLFLNYYFKKGVSKTSKCHYFDGTLKDYLKTPNLCNIEFSWSLDAFFQI